MRDSHLFRDEVTYGYDPKGRLDSVAGTGLPAGGVRYTYTASTDLLGGLEYQDGSQNPLVSSAYTYEFEEQDKYRPLRTVVENKRHPGTVTTVSKYTYAYDTLGRRTSVVYTASAFAQAHLFKWGYNPRSELTDADRHQGTDPGQPGTQYGTNGDFAYAYDPIGNRQTFTLDGAGTPLRYCTNSLNQYEDTYAAATPDCPPTTPIDTFDYDDDGNLVDDGVFAYTWGMENRLIAITPQVVQTGSKKKAEFKYDYRGRRVRKTIHEHDGQDWVVQTDQIFIYDNWNVVLVLDVLESNAITHKYTWVLDLSQSMQGAGGIGGLLAGVDTQGTTTTDDDEPYWYLYDANGNVGQLVRYDDSGPTITLAAHYEYAPYGNPIAAVDVDSSGLVTANPFRFSTKWLDDELADSSISGAIANAGLYYYGYRYYAPTLGRWVSRDTIGEAVDLNLQGFIRNRPTVTVDVLGREGFGCYDTPWGTVCAPPEVVIPPITPPPHIIYPPEDTTPPLEPEFSVRCCPKNTCDVWTVSLSGSITLSLHVGLTRVNGNLAAAAHCDMDDYDKFYTFFGAGAGYGAELGGASFSIGSSSATFSTEECIRWEDHMGPGRLTNFGVAPGWGFTATWATTPQTKVLMGGLGRAIDLGISTFVGSWDFGRDLDE